MNRAVGKNGKNLFPKITEIASFSLPTPKGVTFISEEETT